MNDSVGYKGVTYSGPGFVYAPYIPRFMTKPEIFIKPGYKGEWVVNVPFLTFHSVVAWCTQTFGEPGNHRRYRWRRSYNEITSHNNRVFLRHQSDLMVFRLKWGEQIANI
jgi:hypothetical protein